MGQEDVMAVSNGMEWESYTEPKMRQSMEVLTQNSFRIPQLNSLETITLLKLF